MGFLALTSVWGMCLFISQFKFIRNSAPITALCGIIVILFLFGTVGLLAIGAKLLIIFGILSLIFFIVSTIKNFSNIKKISLGTSLFILSSIVWLVLTKNVILFGWDEFFWSLFTKALVHTNHFYSPLDAIFDIHARYPPGMPLLQYFFTTFAHYTDGVLYFANGLMILSTIAILIDLAQKKILLILLALLGSFFLITAFFGVPYLSIINDPILGVLFGAGLLLVSYYDKLSNKQLLLLLVPILATLSIVKETGLVMAGIIVGTFFVRGIFYDCLNNKNFKWNFFKICIFTIIALVIPLCVHELWVLYLKHIVVTTPYHAYNFENFYTTLFNPTDMRQTLMRDHMIVALNTQKIDNFEKINWSSSLIFWYSCFVGIFMIASLIANHKNMKILFEKFCIVIMVSLGLVGYLAVHLVWYVFIAKVADGQLNSFPRYMGSYLLGVGFWSLGGLVAMGMGNWVKKTFVILILLIINYIIWFDKSALAMIKSIYQPLTTARSAASWQARSQLLTSIALVNKYTFTDSKIYFVFQHSNGLEAMVFRHEIAPHKINSWYWSLGKPYEAEDVWTNPLTISEWRQLLTTNCIDCENFGKPFYDYLLLEKVDDNFWQHYGSMFKPNQEVARHYILFKIEKDRSESIYFTPIIAQDLYRP